MLLKDPRVRFNYADMTPIFASPAGGVVYVPASHGVDNLAEDLDKLKQQKLRFGSPGATSLDLVSALADPKSGVSGNGVSVRVDLGGRRIIQKKHIIQYTHTGTVATIYI